MGMDAVHTYHPCLTGDNLDKVDDTIGLLPQCRNDAANLLIDLGYAVLKKYGYTSDFVQDLLAGK